MRIEVSSSQWAADGQVFGGGVHDDVKLTKKAAPTFAAAEAAGVIRITASSDERKLLGGLVQSQKDGEKEYERAQSDGRWHEGNRQQFDLDVENGVRKAG